MSSNMNKLALKSGLYYTISNFLLKTMGFITTPIFTRLLSRAEFGEFSNFTSWQSIMSIIITLNLSATLINAKYDYEHKFDSYIFSVVVLEIFSSMIWIILVNIFQHFFEKNLKMRAIYINLMIIYILFYGVFNIFQAKERFFYKYKGNATLAILNTVSTMIVSVVFVINFENKLIGRIVGLILPTIVIGITLCFVIAFQSKLKFDFTTWRYALRICLPYIPHSLSLMLLASMDKVMITKYCGVEDTAIYSLAYTCGAVITLLISSMNSAFSPWLGDKLNEKAYHTINNFSYIYMSVFLYLAIGLMLFTPELLYVMGGPDYYSAKFVMAPVSLGIILQFLYTMFVNIEQFQKKTVPMAIVTVIAALSNYFLNAAFLSRFGYIAAAYTTAASYLLLLILHMYIVYKIGLKKVYNYKYISVIVILTIFSSLAVAFLYKVVILRMLTIILYIGISAILLKKYSAKLKIIINMIKG